MEKSVRGGQLNTTLGQLAKDLGGELEGPAELAITGVAAAGTNDPSGIAFAESAQYVHLAKESGVGALLLAPGVDSQGIPAIRVPDPRFAFFFLLKRSERALPIDDGVHATAVVHPSVFLGEGVRVGPYAVIEKGARLGDNCRIYPFAYVGEDCEVGEGTVIGPHAVLVQDVSVGAKSIIHPGAVLGADGFGFAWDGKHRVKIPQVGAVVLGDHVEIGANAAIDRATAGSTAIGNGTKIDNLVQIGHNSSLGDDCAIASLTGISGSTTIGNRVVMAGQCATVDHIKIGDDVTFAGRTAAAQDIAGPGQYIGAPAQPASEGLRNLLLLNKLQDLFARIRKVERAVKAIEAGEQA